VAAVDPFECDVGADVLAQPGRYALAAEAERQAANARAAAQTAARPNVHQRALLVLALVAFHQDAPPVRRRPWLVAPAVGIAVLGLFLLVRPTNPWVLVDWPDLYCVVLVGAAVAHLAAPALGRTLRTPSWSLALVLLGLAVFGLRVVSLLDYALVTAGGQRSALLAVGAGEALAVLAVGGPLARRAAKLLRRLPPVPVAPTASSPPTW
jgi:hypothetical protein